MKKLSPISLFTDNAVAARLWFIVSLVLLAYIVVQPFLIIEAYRTKERVVVMDGANTFSISPLMAFEEATDLHENIALLATQALLSQNPSGSDYPDLLERIFLKCAFEKSQQDLEKIKSELIEKQIHQKQQIFKINILSTRNNLVLAQVSGELVRCGVFESQEFVEALPFKLNLTLARNPNMMTNKRYPICVHDYNWHLEGSTK